MCAEPDAAFPKSFLPFSLNNTTLRMGSIFQVPFQPGVDVTQRVANETAEVTGW